VGHCFLSLFFLIRAWRGSVLVCGVSLAIKTNSMRREAWYR
jgi:hypothetical protein